MQRNQPLLSWRESELELWTQSPRRRAHPHFSLWDLLKTEVSLTFARSERGGTIAWAKVRNEDTTLKNRRGNSVGKGARWREGSLGRKADVFGENLRPLLVKEQ